MRCSAVSRHAVRQFMRSGRVRGDPLQHSCQLRTSTPAGTAGRSSPTAANGPASPYERVAADEAVSDEDQPGSLIGIVLASLVERVTALERGHRPRLRPTVLDPEDVAPASRASIHAQVAEMFTVRGMTVIGISRITGYDAKTIRTYLRKAGAKPPAQKRETA